MKVWVWCVGVVVSECMDKNDVVCAVFHDLFSKELAVKCILDFSVSVVCGCEGVCVSVGVCVCVGVKVWV